MIARDITVVELPAHWQWLGDPTWRSAYQVRVNGKPYATLCYAKQAEAYADRLRAETRGAL